MGILRATASAMFGAALGAALVLYLVGAAPVSGVRASTPPDVIASPGAASPSTASSIVQSVFQQANPGVVSVVSTLNASASGSRPQAPPESGAGTGFVVDLQGNVVTNDHVVEGAQNLRVIFSDGTMASARIVGQDPGNDLAVIKVDVPSSQLHPLSLGDSSKVEVGQTVVAIGNPFNLHNSVTAGIVSGLGRSRPSVNGRSIANMIQTDAPVNPGNSGGPLLDDQGRVVGIVAQIESPVRGSVGVGFAIPVNTLKRYLPELIKGGTVQHPWLGISGQEIRPDLAKRLGLSTTSGVYVVEVVPGSPAATAGLKGATSASSPDEIPTGGDVIVSIDGSPVRSVQDVSSHIDGKAPSDSITLTVIRDGKTVTLTAKLGVWPDRTPR